MEATLRGRHVTLEPLRAQHRDELWPAASEREIWRYMAFDVASPSDLGSWIEKRAQAAAAGTAYAFLQRDAAGVVFGSTSLFDVTTWSAEVGHTWIGASHRRTAANTEAKLLLLRFAFEGLGLLRVQLKCDERNLRSRAAIERLGARREGTIRNQMRLPDGHKRQATVYSITDEEWPTVGKRLEARLAVPVPAD